MSKPSKACRPHGAGEAGLDVGEPDIIGPRTGAQPGPMAAAVIGTVDQNPRHTGGAHLSVLCQPDRSPIGGVPDRL